jgi:acetylornithine/succinyldiaminopimelate/putrescine aminotransferase
MSKLMKHKLLVVKASENCIRLFPSLLSTTDELDMGIKIIKKTCEEMN